MYPCIPDELESIAQDIYRHLQYWGDRAQSVSPWEIEHSYSTPPLPVLRPYSVPASVDVPTPHLPIHCVVVS